MEKTRADEAMMPQMTEDEQSQQSSEAETGAPPSRVPSGAWIAVLLVLGVVAIGAQAFGLRSLVEFGGQKEEWEAAQAQRESLRKGWDKLNAQLETKINANQVTMAKAEAETQAARAQRDDLSADLEGLQVRLSTTRQVLSEAVKAHEDANKALTAAQARKQGAETRAVQLEEECRALSAEIAKLETSRDQTKKMAQEVQATYQQRFAQMRSLTDLLGQWGKDFDEATQALRQVSKDYESAISGKASVVEARTAEEAKLKTLEGLVKDQEGHLKKAKQAYETIMSSLDVYQKRIEQLSTQKIETASKAETAKEQLSEVEKDLATKRGELAAAERRLKTATDQEPQLKQRLAQLKATVVPLGDQERKLKADIAAREQELSAVTKRLASAREREQALLKRITELSKTAQSGGEKVTEGKD